MKKLFLSLSTALIFNIVATAQTNVGIGTNTPASKMDVKGNLTIGGTYSGTAAPADGAIIEGPVGVGTKVVGTNAVLDITSTTKGMYIPRFTNAQRTTLTPSLSITDKGLLIFNTDNNRTEFWDGTQWLSVGVGAGGPPSGAAGGDLAGSYPSPQIANNAITSSKIYDGTITSADLATPAVNASNQIFNTLQVGNGGTGQSSLTSNGVVYGNGGGNVGVTTAPAAGQALIGNASGVPTFAPLSGDVSSVSGTGAVTLTNTTVAPATYGSGTQVAQFTVDSKGRITGASNVAITGAAPTGTASGDLTGSYPSPSIATGTVTSGKILDGTIVDADVNASAAIQRSKLATGTANQVAINDGSGNLSSEAQLAIARGGTNATSANYTSGKFLAYDGTRLSSTGYDQSSFASSSAVTTAVSGTTNYVSKFTGTNTIGNSQLYDNGTSIGIGTTGPSQKLDVQGGSINTSGNVTASGVVTAGASAVMGTNINGGYYQDATNGAYRSITNTGTVGYYFQNNAGASTSMYVGLAGPYAGNVGIGTNSPAARLQVRGGKAYVNQLGNDPTASYVGADLVLGDDVTVRNGYSGTNGSNLMLQSADKSSITALDQGNNLGQISYQNLVWTIGEDVGWGTQTIKLPNLGSGLVKASAGVLSVASGSDVPSGSGSYIQNGTSQQASANFNISGSGQFAGNLKRSDHAVGFLEGSYNNVGANDAKSNPIYTIGSSYNPTNTALGNMYGIGYSHSNFWGTASNRPSDWGLYVSAAGVTRVILDAGSGIVWAASQVRAPAFYDIDNMAYYVDPASTTNLNNLRFTTVDCINGNCPPNNAIRLTPNLHLNSGTGSAVILNWDNGTSGATQTLRIGNGAGSDVFDVLANGSTGIGVPNPAYKFEIATGATFGWGDGTDGSYKSRTETRNDAGQIGAQSGFYQTSAPAPAGDWPTNTSSWQHLIDCRHSNNGNNYAMQFAGSFFDQDIYARKTNNSATQSWGRVVTSNNIAFVKNEYYGVAGPNVLNAVTGYSGWMDVKAGDNIKLDGMYYGRLTSGSNDEYFYTEVEITGQNGCSTSYSNWADDWHPTEASADHDNFKPVPYMDVWTSNCTGQIRFRLMVQVNGDDNWETRENIITATRY